MGVCFVPVFVSLVARSCVLGCVNASDCVFIVCLVNLYVSKRVNM